MQQELDEVRQPLVSPFEAVRLADQTSHAAERTGARTENRTHPREVPRRETPVQSTDEQENPRDRHTSSGRRAEVVRVRSHRPSLSNVRHAMLSQATRRRHAKHLQGEHRSRRITSNLQTRTRTSAAIQRSVDQAVRDDGRRSNSQRFAGSREDRAGPETDSHHPTGHRRRDEDVLVIVCPLF